MFPPVLLVALLGVLPDSLFGQLFLPATHAPRSLQSSTDCACNSPKARQAKTLQQQQKLLDQQALLKHNQLLDEEKKVRALVTLLNKKKEKKTKKEEATTAPAFIEMARALNDTLVGTLKDVGERLAELEGKVKKEGGGRKKDKKKKRDRKEKKEKGEKQKNSGNTKKSRRKMHRHRRDADTNTLDEPLKLPVPGETGGEHNRCNSERLRRIIKGAKGRDTAAIKRNIQALAERQFDAKYNVVCASEDFSYISNTEEFCQDQVNGTTCYVFRQLDKGLSGEQQHQEFPRPPGLEQFGGFRRMRGKARRRMRA